MSRSSSKSLILVVGLSGVTTFVAAAKLPQLEDSQINLQPAPGQQDRQELALALLNASLDCTFTENKSDGSTAHSVRFTGDTDFLSFETKFIRFTFDGPNVSALGESRTFKAAYANLTVSGNDGNLDLKCKEAAECSLVQTESHLFADGSFGLIAPVLSGDGESIKLCDEVDADNVRIAIDVLASKAPKSFEDEPAWSKIAGEDADLLRAFALNFPWSPRSHEANKRLAVAKPPTKSRPLADWPTLPENREFFAIDEAPGFMGPDDKMYPEIMLFRKGNRLYADGRVGKWVRVHDRSDRPAFVRRSLLVEDGDFNLIQRYRIEQLSASNLLMETVRKSTKLVTAGLYTSTCNKPSTEPAPLRYNMESSFIYWGVGDVIYRSTIKSPRDRVRYELGRKSKETLIGLGKMTFYDLKSTSDGSPDTRVSFSKENAIWEERRNEPGNFDGYFLCYNMTEAIDYANTLWGAAVTNYIALKEKFGGY